MTIITNDTEFQAAINDLEIAQQRAVAALFVKNVVSLNKDERIMHALNVAENTDASKDELQMVYKSAKAAHVESYTSCGADGDWFAQAGHHVATATAAAVNPNAEANIAWEVAMHCRLARTCERIAQEQSYTNTENQDQYQLLADFSG